MTSIEGACEKCRNWDNRCTCHSMKTPPAQAQKPLPWKFDNSDTACWTIKDADGESIFGSSQYYPWVSELDFPFIVQACNSYAANQETIRELVEALKNARSWMQIDAPITILSQIDDLLSRSSSD